MKNVVLLLLAMYISLTNLFGQFHTIGTAVNTGANTYKLTDAVNNQFGAIWYKIQHDLNTIFNIQGQMYFGTDDAGADGIAFVMHRNCLTAGSGGGGLGYSGIAGQSIAVEFDTYWNRNTPPITTGAEENYDPEEDHISVQLNGDVVHDNSPNDLTPSPILLPNIEDGNWHDFQIFYNPVSNVFQVWFDGVLRITLTYDVRNTLFGGAQYAYWGFTSTTGGFNNEQRIRINAATSTLNLKDVTICTGPVYVSLPSLASLVGTNLALNKPVTASTALSSPSFAVDGNMGTRWESIHDADPQWLYVDLASPMDIDSVVIYWEAARAKDYMLQTSTDAVSWTTVYSTTTGSGHKDKIIFSATNIRYVRMYGTARLIGYGYSIWEFQVYGKPKYVWAPDNGTISDIYGENVTLTPTATTTYSVTVPDPCLGAVVHNMTVTIDCPAPANLIQFNAIKNPNGTLLEWTTASEINTSHFEILKSTDGIHFFPIGIVHAAGYSSAVLTYSFFDEKNNGSAYYQIKTVDIDQTYHLSPITYVSMTIQPLHIGSIFENETPLTLKTNFEYIYYRLTDLSGKIVEERYIKHPPHIIWLGAQWAPSCYILYVETDGYFTSEKICKYQ
ncbi:MAG: discoidin domain-containing protein [Cytophagaceae bacterium]|nr:discoidin domain-containing protein [Cytophagaceae bacterium]MDW8455926.1 discoidin domain-containing protein [Cytophagaceae bacterium]